MLYPPSFRDLIVQLAINDEFELLLPDIVLDELENALARSGRVSRGQARFLTQKLSSAFEIVAVPDSLRSNDERILRFAEDVAADVLVTENLRDFVGISPVAVLTLSQLFSSLERGRAGLMAETISQVTARYQKPYRTIEQHLSHLQGMGLDTSVWSLECLQKTYPSMS